MKSLDAFLPTYEFSTQHAVAVAVDPIQADGALRGSQRKFGRYWRIVRPFSGPIRIVVLRAAKRRAEAA